MRRPLPDKTRMIVRTSPLRSLVEGFPKDLTDINTVDDYWHHRFPGKSCLLVPQSPQDAAALHQQKCEELARSYVFY